jgi:hypothetical protein
MSNVLVRKSLEVVGVVAAMLVTYNLFIVAEVAAGKHQEYIWWLHFPSKFFFSFFG